MRGITRGTVLPDPLTSPVPDAVRPSRWSGVAERVVGPVSLFIAVYVATLVLTARFIPFTQWAALVSVAVATAILVAGWDRGRWPLGLFVRVPLAIRECLFGIGVAVVLIGGADVLMMFRADMSRSGGAGFSLFELAAVFVPAVLHEELLFRGYAFQRVWVFHRRAALIGGTLLFAALHAGNQAVTWLALFNILLGGILLSLAWERYRRLWFPIGLHFGWNFMSGPVLGYEVSGYVPDASLFRTTVSGPIWLTGGAFGIEGSVLLTVLIVVAIIVMARRKGFTTETRRHGGFTEESSA